MTARHRDPCLPPIRQHPAEPPVSGMQEPAALIPRSGTGTDPRSGGPVQEVTMRRLESFH